MTYLGVIRLAFFTFPLLALLITLPYLVRQYRRVGAVQVWRSALVYSLALYLLCVVFLVLLPLPADRTADYGIEPQLQPFDWVLVAMRSGVRVSLEHPRTWLVALKNPNVYGAVFNVLMLVPWGFYLRYLFKRRWWQALFAGFFLSLSFELTQLTGDWGLYAHPYRHFDVDDLIGNTTGTMVGFWLTCLIQPLLPSLERADERSWARNLRYPSLLRRAVAFVVDCGLAACAAVFVASVWVRGTDGVVDDAALVFGWFCGTGLVGVLVPTLTGAGTPGELLCKLRVRGRDGGRAGRGRILLRQALLWWGALWLVPAAAVLAPSSLYVGHAAAMRTMAEMIAALWGLTVIVRAVLAAGGRRPYVGVPGLLSGTRVLSEAQVDAETAR